MNKGNDLLSFLGSKARDGRSSVSRPAWVMKKSSCAWLHFRECGTMPVLPHTTGPTNQAALHWVHTRGIPNEAVQGDVGWPSFKVCEAMAKAKGDCA